MPGNFSRVTDETSNLEIVSLNPKHYRSGRWFLLAEGVLVAALGVAALVLAAVQPHHRPAGVWVIGMSLNTAQGALLLGFGLLAIAASFRRRTAVMLSTAGAIGWTSLLICAMTGAAHGVRGPLGFDVNDGLLYAGLAAYSMAMLLWLAPDAMEGPAWVPRRRIDSASDGSPPGESHPAT